MGQINIAVVGDSYSRTEQAMFLQDLENIKSELYIRLWQRQSQFAFIPLTWNNRFQVKESNLFDGGTFNQNKVLAEVNSSGVSWNYILVIAKNIKGGSGASISMAGALYHDTLHSGQVGVHELAHTLFLGDGHTGGFMNASCNDGACGVNATFTVAQFVSINQVMNKVAGVLPCAPPTVFITSPAVFSGTTYTATASFTGMVQHTEVLWDGVSKIVIFNWSRQSSYNGSASGVNMPIFNVTPGVHTLTVKSTDYNNQVAEATIQITIQ